MHRKVKQVVVYWFMRKAWLPYNQAYYLEQLSAFRSNTSWILHENVRIFHLVDCTSSYLHHKQEIKNSHFFKKRSPLRYITLWKEIRHEIENENENPRFTMLKEYLCHGQNKEDSTSTFLPPFPFPLSLPFSPILTIFQHLFRQYPPIKSPFCPSNYFCWSHSIHASFHSYFRSSTTISSK